MTAGLVVFLAFCPIESILNQSNGYFPKAETEAQGAFGFSLRSRNLSSFVEKC